MAKCVLFAAAPHHIEASCGLMTSTHHKILTHRLQMLHGIERSQRERERETAREYEQSKGGRSSIAELRVEMMSQEIVLEICRQPKNISYTQYLICV